METVLDSVRVVEMTEALAGPYCAMLLGDFGADVIKVERPGSGDQSRNWGPPFVGTESAYYLAANRNKRSITLNYDHPRGAEALLKPASIRNRCAQNFRASSIAASPGTDSPARKQACRVTTSWRKRKPA